MNEDKKIKVLFNTHPSGHMCGRVYHPGGVCPTIAVGHGAVPLILTKKKKMIENNKEDFRACAFRTREWAGGHVLEVGGPVANALTSVVKDSMVLMKKRRKVAKIIGYTRDKEGKVVRRHLHDIANTLCPGNLGGCRNTSQYVLEIKASKDMDDEYYYAVRKFTPRECFRLMDVDEESIDKLQSATVVTKTGRAKPAIAKTAQCKLAGNSIVVACLEGILKRMFIKR